MKNRICAAAFLVLSGASALAAADCARPPAPPAKSEWGFVRELATPPVRTPRERFRRVAWLANGAEEGFCNYLKGIKEGDCHACFMSHFA